VLLFAHPPGSVPREWIAEQKRLALSPGYLEAHLSVLRALVSPFGQCEVLVERLPALEIPTFVVWGARDRVFPESQAREAFSRLQGGSPSSLTVAICPTSSVLIASCQPSKGSSPNGCIVDRGRPEEARGYPGNLYGDLKPVSF
jgi:pimeloyl-ACP methyl ester carboxylesterase